jgi:hypothetical protein
MRSRLALSRSLASWWRSTRQRVWLWGPIAAVLTGSFGGLMRDLFRHDRVVANLRGEFYPEIAALWGLAFAILPPCVSNNSGPLTLREWAQAGDPRTGRPDRSAATLAISHERQPDCLSCATSHRLRPARGALEG